MFARRFEVAPVRKDVRPLAFSMGTVERGFERAYARAVNRYINRLKASADGADIIAAINRGDAAALANSAKWVEANRKFKAEVNGLLLDVISATGIKAGGRLGVLFTLDNPYSLKWATEHAAELVTMVGNTTRDALRAFVTGTLESGTTTRNLAIQIRDVIGITERQARRLANLELEWLKERPMLSDAEINRRIAQMTEQMIAERALLIARTEIITAANQGQLASWRVAVDEGAVLPTTVKVWIAAVGSDRTCPICMELDGQRAKLSGTFPGDRMAPPAHPACRCTMGLETLTPRAYASAFAE